MPDRPLTILQLTHHGTLAGSTQSIFSLSRELARRGHRVLVGCREGVWLARLAREAGLPVVPLEFAPLGRLCSSLAEVIARERVDVVNSHDTRDRRALTWLRWRGRLPQAFVVTRRTMPLTSPVELLAVGLTAERTIAVSGAVAHDGTPERDSRSFPTGSRSSASTRRSRRPHCRRRGPRSVTPPAAPSWWWSPG